MSRANTKQQQKILLAIVTYLTLAGLLIGALFPFYWMGLTSLRKGKQVYVKEQVLVPRDQTINLSSRNARRRAGCATALSWPLAAAPLRW